MNFEGMIDISRASIADIVGAAYNLSRPQGMGQLHYRPGPLSAEEIEHIIGTQLRQGNPISRLSMDYIKGRAVKMTVFITGGKKYIRFPWYDHSKGQLEELLTELGFTAEETYAAIAEAQKILGSSEDGA